MGGGEGPGEGKEARGLGGPGRQRKRKAPFMGAPGQTNEPLPLRSYHPRPRQPVR